LESLDFKSFFTSNTGRINRKPYLFYYFLPAIAAAIILNILGVIILSLIPVLSPIFSLLSLAIALAGIMPGVKRLHDMNYSGLLYLLILVPIANLVLIILLCAKQGSVGPNQFGEDPLA
jgi:uncharacterized membrane protein YhaH (DUF805 family)